MSATTETMSGAELVRRAGCTYRQFDYWRRQTSLFGEKAVALGSGGWNDGRFNVFTEDDVLRATVATIFSRAFGSRNAVEVALLKKWADAAVEGQRTFATLDERVVICISLEPEAP